MGGNGANLEPRLKLVGRAVLGLGLGLVALACQGQIGSIGGHDGANANGNPSGGANGGGGGGEAPVLPPARDPNEAGYQEGEQGVTDRPAPTTRVARLTHTQWSNTVHDLFGIDVSALAKDFRSDPAEQGFLFDDNVLSLSVDEALWGSYQRAAADIAGQVTGDATRLGQILPPDGSDATARARTFVTDFGYKVFRRPLTTAEVDDYMKLYGSAAGAYEGLSDFDAGVRLLLEAFLQAPQFLYRIEASTTKSGDVIPLAGYEIASRLSYMLWNTMPDAALLDAAKQGNLGSADKVAEQAERMLADPRASDVIASFHDQLLNVAHYETISPAAAFFPDAPADLATLAAKETDAFIRDVASTGGGFVDLLTADHSFVNAGLAKIYGLSGAFDDTFKEAKLDPTQRKGILTQVGFLASNATTTIPDPIHRGVFIARRLMCTHIAAPPGNVPPLPPANGRTNRQTVEDHTQQPNTVCVTCHGSTINPLGFPFESYDATGAWRTEDQGQPVDTKTDPTIDGKQVHVAGALDLVDQIAKSSAAHECYAKHWVEFAYGRPSVEADDPLVTRLGADSAKGTLSIKDVILGLVKTEAFLTRSTEELP